LGTEEERRGCFKGICTNVVPFKEKTTAYEVRWLLLIVVPKPRKGLKGEQRA